MKNAYEIRGDVTAIELRRPNGDILETLVDTADLEVADAVPGTWCASGPRRLYAITHNRVTVYLHREILDAPQGMVVDHINHDALDNRRANLRVVTGSVNQSNRAGPQRNNASGYRGVVWNAQRRKFCAYLHVEGRTLNLGRYATAIEAAMAVHAGLAEVDPIAAANYSLMAATP